MDTHSFGIDIATEYGIEEALLLGYVYHWVCRNQEKGTNFHDGKYWTFDSRRALAKKFPYMSEHKIYRILSKLIKQGLILTGNFNKLGKDRTTWYTLSDKGLSLFNGDFSIVQNEPTHCAELHNPLCENAQPIVQNCTSHCAELHNPLCENAQPLPIQYTNSILPIQTTNRDNIKQTQNAKMVNQKTEALDQHAGRVNKCVEYYQSAFHPFFNRTEANAVMQMGRDYTFEQFKAAADIAKNNGINHGGTWKYVAKVLATTFSRPKKKGIAETTEEVLEILERGESLEL